MGNPVQTPQNPAAAPPQQPQAAPPVQQPQAPQPADLHSMPTADVRAVASAPGTQAPGVQPQQPQAPPAGIQRPVRQADGNFVLDTPWRSRYVGRTEQEVYDQLYAAQGNAITEIQRANQDRERLRQGVRAAVSEGGPAAGEPEAFHPEIYRQLQAADPQTAEWYVLQHMFKFDTIEEAQQRIPRFFDIVERIEQNMVVGDFHRMAPEFPATAQAVDALMNEFERSGMELTPENLLHIHRSLLYANSRDPRIGYAPLPQELGAPGVPTMEPTDPRQVMARMYGIGPEGNYAFNADRGFGAAPAPPVMYPPAGQAPVTAAAPPSGYPPRPGTPAYPAYPAYPAPAAAPAATPGYPPQPAAAAPAYPYPPAAPAAIPVPSLYAPGSYAPASYDENVLYGMEKAALREYVERGAGGR
jgi:hypothetical protein